MTKHNFILGLALYYSGLDSFSKELNGWTEFVKNNTELFRAVILPPHSRPTLGEAQRLYKIHTSPLAKALR